MKLFRTVVIFMLLITAAFAATQAHQGVSFDAPVTLTTEGPQASTTNQGKPFTETIYTASLQNDDTYVVAVSEYGFSLADTDLDLGTDAFAASLKGTVVNRKRNTISGLPAEYAVVDSTMNGRTLRFYFAMTYKGNSAYMFAFGTWMDSSGTDTEAVARFFTSLDVK